jgi:hypothetical protein
VGAEALTVKTGIILVDIRLYAIYFICCRDTAPVAVEGYRVR